jgi:hypothetical protein
MATVLTERTYTGDWLKGEVEVPQLFSRDQITLKSNGSTVVTLQSGTVLGKIKAGTATSAAKSGGNTGNGTLTVDVSTPVVSGAQNGVYTVRLIAAAANAGTFRVTDPSGNVLGDVGVGSTFTDQIKFATADGATDFVVGDGFDITVALATSKWVQLSLTATDGSQIAAGILFDLTAVPATGDLQGVAVTRQATVADVGLTWPVGATTNQIAAAVAQTEHRGHHRPPGSVKRNASYPQPHFPGPALMSNP